MTDKRKAVLAAKRARSFERYHAEPAHREAKKTANRIRRAEVRANETPVEREKRLAALSLYVKLHRAQVNARRRMRAAQARQ